MLEALALGGALSIGGGLMNYFSNMSAADRARALQDKALQEFIGIAIPDPERQKLALERFVSQGTLTPELESAIQAAPSEFNKIVTNQKLKASQNRALSRMEQMGLEGGLRLQDKAALQDAQMQAQVQDRASRNAILDDMNRRGQGGSGMALQAQLQGQQAAGDRAARSSLAVAAGAQDRALQALMQSGELASKYRGQDFQEQEAKAQANDAINKFNTQNLRDVMSANTGYRNRANEMNLAERQRLSDSNVNTSNKEQQYNKELLQQQYENKMRMAQAKANVYSGQAQGEIQRGQAQGNLWSNLGNAGAGAATSYGAYQNQTAQNKANQEFQASQAQLDRDAYGGQSSAGLQYGNDEPWSLMGKKRRL